MVSGFVNIGGSMERREKWIMENSRQGVIVGVESEKEIVCKFVNIPPIVRQFVNGGGGIGERSFLLFNKNAR